MPEDQLYDKKTKFKRILFCIVTALFLFGGPFALLYLSVLNTIPL